MKRRKELFLDFTPLLDVTLIILFFFVLFANVELVETKAGLEAQTEQVAQTQAKLDQQAAELEEELALVAEEAPRRESDLQALLQFGSSANVKLILDLSGQGPEFRILQGNRLAASVQSAEDVIPALRKVLEEAGSTSEDTIFCDFVLDGSQPGTAAAYRGVLKELAQFKKEFRYFYYSETDISLGKE